MNFWRSKDIYSDHVVRCYERNDLPLRRIDNSGFMIGTTGTCYYRKTAAWKGMLVLSLARGGLVNTYYGNLDLLNEADGRWFADLQKLFFGLHAQARITTFGGMPGRGEPYGFAWNADSGSVIAVVNPSQAMQQVTIPLIEQPSLLFTDSGFHPIIEASTIVLGPEQLALLGSGVYAHLNFGHEADVFIPSAIEKLDVHFTQDGDKAICMEIPTGSSGTFRMIVKQVDQHGRVVRTTGGSPPYGKTLGELLQISVEQSGTPLPVQINYDKAIWSGLSWAVAELTLSDTRHPISIRCTTAESQAVNLQGSVYRVTYP
jgi:hypothetical protein